MKIPIWVSNRHIHLSQEHADILFWKNYKFQALKKLSQPGQFAYQETIIAKWPKGTINKIRILWPVRTTTQIEILMSDNYLLGIDAPLRISGDLENSWWWIIIIWPKGELKLNNGIIIAKRHLHASTEQAKKLWITNWQTIKIQTEWPRSVVFENVIVRAWDKYNLDFHIDREEWNTAWIYGQMFWKIIR